MTSSLSPFTRVRRRAAATLTALALTAGGLTGCGLDSLAATATTTSGAASSVEGTVWDAESVHEVSLDVDPDEFATMLETYQDTGEKEWLVADVTIDGQTISDAGIRLKGNSSLRGVAADADPAELPWLIDLDQFVDGQSLDGWESFVIRSNNTETSLNEAVALELLQEAGLASEEAVAVSFTANDSDATLRLLIQDLDNTWDEATFGTDGTLYKSESTGDWSYRGDDATAYEDVFDIEAGTDDYEPLTDFLQWLEEASDEEFADGLSDRLDVDAFATYLAFEDLIGNFDDIDGPGNNSFLRWDEDTQQMTVVAWDHNLAFGVVNGGGAEGAGEGPGGGLAPADGAERPEQGERPERPEGFEPPDAGALADGDGPEGDALTGERPMGDAAGGPGGSNVLSERFLATAEFVELYDSAVERLQAELFDDGTAQDVLDSWTAVLTDQAGDLVDASTVETDAEQVASYFDGHAVEE